MLGDGDGSWANSSSTISSFRTKPEARGDGGVFETEARRGEVDGGLSMRWRRMRPCGGGLCLRATVRQRVVLEGDGEWLCLRFMCEGFLSQNGGTAGHII